MRLATPLAELPPTRFRLFVPAPLLPLPFASWRSLGTGEFDAEGPSGDLTSAMLVPGLQYKKRVRNCCFDPFSKSFAAGPCQPMERVGLELIQEFTVVEGKVESSQWEVVRQMGLDFNGAAGASLVFSLSLL